MLIKRNVYFSAVDQETGEERLFSVSEVLSEDEYLERLYAEKADEESKARKATRVAGKTAMAVGGTAALTGGVIGAKKTLDFNKAYIKKHDLIDLGKGKVMGIGKGAKAAENMQEVGMRYMKNNKVFRRAVKADKIGTGLALAGGVAAIAARKKKSEKKD